jgi:tetratricopeptide (TPR) repeat protein
MARALRRVSLMGCVCVLAGALSSAPPVSARQSSSLSFSSTSELIASYADWIHGRRKDVELGAMDLDAAQRQLARFDPSSLPTTAAAGTKEAREEQRRLITTFALEIAAVGSKKHSAAAARLVEWACAYVRAHSPHNDFDRAWQLAALAVLEGGIDSAALHDHIDHVQSFARDEPRLVLARGIAEEQFSAPSEVLTRTPIGASLAKAREIATRAEGERFRASERAITRFREAATIESIKGEALLRAGHVQYRLGQYDAALATWRGLEPSIQDPALMFLLHLFRGMALEDRARLDEARQSYLAALKLSPGAHSATMRLAAMGYRFGHDAEPVALIDTLLKTADARRDPWWSYYAADWRFWYPRIDRVRALLR